MFSPVPARPRMPPGAQVLQICARAMVALTEPTLTDPCARQARDSVTSSLSRLRYACARLACAYLMFSPVLARPYINPEPLASRREARATVLLTDAYYTYPCCTCRARQSMVSTRERSRYVLVRSACAYLTLSLVPARLCTPSELLTSLREARATVAVTHRLTYPPTLAAGDQSTTLTRKSSSYTLARLASAYLTPSPILTRLCTPS